MVRFPAGATDFSRLKSIQTSSGAHAASFAMGTFLVFPRGEEAGTWNCTSVSQMLSRCGA